MFASRLSSLASLLFLLAALAVLASPAAAQDVAVAPFTGPRGAAARSAVVEVIEEAGPLRSVSAEAPADLIVSGRVRGRGRAARVRITVEDRDGRRLSARVLSMRRRGRFQDGVEALLRRAVARHRRAAPSRSAPRAAAAAPREAREEALGAEERPPSRRGEGEPAGRAPTDGPLRPLVEVVAGARLAGRLATIEMADGDRRKNDVAYPELTLAASARPWRDAAGVERGLVLRGFFGHAVGLRSVSSLTEEPVETTFFRAYGEVGLLFEPDPIVELGLGIGFGWDAFAFAPQTTVVLPSAEYAYLRPNLRGRFRIERELAVLDLALGYRGVLARGELAGQFGEGGQTQGFDVTARLGGSLDLGFAYGVEAGVTSYFHFFSGDAVTPAREGTDVGLWLGAYVGFAIR